MHQGLSREPAAGPAGAGLGIGTSGWSYPDWQADFYAGVKRADWLAWYASHFDAVEINASFYRLQRPDTLRHWYAQTPPAFRFALKANRYLTHRKRLLDPTDPVRIEREHALALADKLAVVLWQLPASLRRCTSRLDDLLDALGTWPEVRHAVEFRHPSWFDAAVLRELRLANVATCISDAADWPMWQAVSCDLVYVRLHGHTRTYASAYHPSALRRWAEWIRDWRTEGREVHVYFDNDAGGAAVRDARRLKALVS
ncbi:MAG: DUF72 domain-containing protein [Gammaproteobacteria bacterium]|nr:DUF72 domain-containing protein [Gammaproteobacteria bacterium]